MRRGRRLDLLRRCRDEFGTAIILITDNMGIVADLADRVDVMYPGDVLKELRAEQPLPAPKHPYTQRLLGAVKRTHRSVVLASSARLCSVSS